MEKMERVKGRPGTLKKKEINVQAFKELSLDALPEREGKVAEKFLKVRDNPLFVLFSISRRYRAPMS